MVRKLAKLGCFILGFIPQPLPVGKTALSDYCARIFETYDLPDMPSYRQAIASMIMHLGPTTYYKAPWFFAISVKKAMANQVAYELIDQIRTDQKQAEQQQLLTKEAKETPTGEMTPETAPSVDEPVSIQNVQVSQS